MNASIDYYELLEVHPKASPEIIKKAYVTLAKRYHPDVSRDATSTTEKMTLLNEAYEILSNPQKRAEYDNLRINTPNNANQHAKAESSARHDDTDVDWKMFDTINKTCQPLLEALKNQLIRDDGNEAHNKSMCDAAMQTFSREVGPYLDLLKNCPKNHQSKYRPAMDIVAITLWNIASGYTWAQEFIIAENIIDAALIYADPAEEYFVNLRKSVENIKINATKQKHWQSRTASNSFVSSQKIFFAAIVVITIMFSALSSLFQPSNTSSPAPVKPPVTQTPGSNKQVDNKQAAAPVELPNPKQGVVTQYVPGKPVLATNGYCEITIDNSQNDYPVYVRVWDLDKNTPIRSFTIMQGQKFTAESITPGKYQVKYVPLYENIESKTAYKSEPIQLTQKDTGSGTEYDIYSLTLYKVRHGNTKTFPIPLTEL
jgi:hypothetical protein